MTTAKALKNLVIFFNRLVVIFVVMAMVGCASNQDSLVEENDLAEADLFDGLESEAQVAGEGEAPYVANWEDAGTPAENVYADDNIVTNAGATSDGSPAYDYYYIALGGESLSRLAYALYDDRSARSKITEMNPDLKGSQQVTGETKVFFDMDAAQPRSEFLTKGMIDRYKEVLLEKIRARRMRDAGNADYATVVVQRGDTLQQISERIYGTTRLWTELYILNQDRIQNYDQLVVGTSLNYFPVSDFTGTQVASASDTQTDNGSGQYSAYKAESAPVKQESWSQPAPKAVVQEIRSEPVESPSYVPEPVAVDEPEGGDDFASATAVTETTTDTFADEAMSDPVDSVPQNAAKPLPIANAMPESPGVAAETEPSPVEDNLPAKTANDNFRTRNNPVSGGIPVDPQEEQIAQGVSMDQNAEAGAAGTVTRKQIRPPQPGDRAKQAEAGGFVERNLRRIVYTVLLILIIGIGYYFITKPRGLKKSKFGGVQPVPRTTVGASPRPRTAPTSRTAPRSNGQAPRRSQQTGSSIKSG